MTQDARFEDASERPVRLLAQSAEDLEVVSALLQDAVAKAEDFAWLRRKRRFVMVLNRFRWEDRDRAERGRRAYERVRTLVAVENVLSVKASGVSPDEPEQALSVLRLEFQGREEPEDPSGVLRVILAGDGEFAVEVEYLDLRAEDVTRPYAAPSGKAPEHPGD